MAANETTPAATGSILDIIFEKTANIEQATNSQVIKIGLEEAIKITAKRERALRASTITIKLRENLTHSCIMEEIDNWIDANEQLPTTNWQDKEYSYCQFACLEAKNAFLDYIQVQTTQSNVKEQLVKANEVGAHFTRKPAKLEIQNVRANIKAERVKEILERATSANGPVTEFREGKANPITKSRSIFFKTNAQGVSLIINKMDGAIPYTNKETGTRVKLPVKINVKPWQCRDCWALGQHQCKGKLCAQCGLQGHLTKECKSKTKQCNNCKRKGHRTKDVHCPVYLNEVSKELRKIDIPLECLEDKELRFVLIKHLQIK